VKAKGRGGKTWKKYVVYDVRKLKLRREDALNCMVLRMAIHGNMIIMMNGFCYRKCVHMFVTGDGLLKQSDMITIDNLPQIFTTNVFGHFVLVRL